MGKFVSFPTTDDVVIDINVEKISAIKFIDRSTTAIFVDGMEIHVDRIICDVRDDIDEADPKAYLLPIG